MGVEARILCLDFPGAIPIYSYYQALLLKGWNRKKAFFPPDQPEIIELVMKAKEMELWEMW